MNTPALIGMLIGSIMIVYMLRPLFQFLVKKIIEARSERIEKNISVVLSAVFCTFVYYLINEELVLYYAIGSLIIITLGFLPNKKKENVNG